ncbi:hypothetical protein [Paenibacillus caui]|uniref:hypothetical protein n=1 Tax=Paenibacillus caui TaxID=2873927 RepID=UPI001CA837F7|nr:hypothetical protein [Paenibacillus caui]
MTISRAEAEQRAKQRWRYWRLLLSDIGISYSDLHQMDEDDVAEANAALDLYLKQQTKRHK